MAAMLIINQKKQQQQQLEPSLILNPLPVMHRKLLPLPVWMMQNPFNMLCLPLA